MRRNPPSAGLVITGTSTAVGKTTVARGLARLYTSSGARVAALKPFETGVSANPEDAMALARACGRPELAHAPGLYRAAPPLAPLSIELAGGRPCEPPRVADAVRSAAAGSDFTLVEGAGGIAVPLTRTISFVDFASWLGWPLVLVARNELGVLSHVMAAVELCRTRKLEVRAVALTIDSVAPDPSCETNATTLEALLDVSIAPFALPARRDDDSLAAAASPLFAALPALTTRR